MSLRSSRTAILASASLLGAVLAANGQTSTPPPDNLNLRYTNGIVAIAEE